MDKRKTYTESQWNREIGWGKVPDEYRHSDPTPELKSRVMERSDFYVEDSGMGDGSITVSFSCLFDSEEEAEKMIRYLISACNRS